jgi:hypothetical protein
VAASGQTVDPRRIEVAAHALNGAYEWLAGWWMDHPDISPETLADWFGELVRPGLRDLTG